MREFRFAVRLAVPLLFTYVFVGLAAGLLLRQAGYALIWVFLSAALVYAGSMQIIMVPLMTSGAGLPTLALTAFLINARHIFYGIGFVEKFRKIGGWRYPFMALTVTDETYSVLCALACPEDLEEEKVQFDLLAFCYGLWVVSCTAGALLGQSLPVDLTGVELLRHVFLHHRGGGPVAPGQDPCARGAGSGVGGGLLPGAGTGGLFAAGPGGVSGGAPLPEGPPGVEGGRAPPCLRLC